MIRTATTADLDWLLDLALETAERCNDPIEPGAATRWLHLMVTAPTCIAVRGDHSAGFAFYSAGLWNPTVGQCQLQNLISRPSRAGSLEALAVLREIDARRRALGVSKFYLVSSGADLTPFAKRMGARAIGSMHVLDAAL